MAADTVQLGANCCQDSGSERMLPTDQKKIQLRHRATMCNTQKTVKQYTIAHSRDWPERKKQKRLL